MKYIWNKINSIGYINTTWPEEYLFEEVKNNFTISNFSDYTLGRKYTFKIDNWQLNANWKNICLEYSNICLWDKFTIVISVQDSNLNRSNDTVYYLINNPYQKVHNMKRLWIYWWYEISKLNWIIDCAKFYRCQPKSGFYNERWWI